MDVLYLLPSDSWSAEWTEGQGRPLVNTQFSPPFVCVCMCLYVYACVSAYPGCCPVPVSYHGSSGGGLRASFSLPICPSTAFASLGLPHWQAVLPQWWMTVRLVSVSESCTSATCRVGPCQRLPVRSAVPFCPPPLFIPLFIFILHFSHLTFI